MKLRNLFTILIPICLLSSSLVAVEPGGVSTGGVSNGKPNVLFIAVDDLNHWVGYLGRNEQT